jgi:hypothetical protein
MLLYPERSKQMKCEGRTGHRHRMLEGMDGAIRGAGLFGRLLPALLYPSRTNFLPV